MLYNLCFFHNFMGTYFAVTDVFPSCFCHDKRMKRIGGYVAEYNEAYTIRGELW